jgi:extracellular factor (EF) 3-hydroxypalmitic acid methyl ester biosynthesis protein
MTTATLPAIPSEPLFHAPHGRIRSPLDRLQRLLDRTSEQLAALDLSRMNDFVHELDRIRRDASPSQWSQLIDNVVKPHRVLEQLHEEPFTRRAFEKPRGYAGDAPLLDLAYRERPYCVELTRLGAALHAWTDSQPASVSVRERRSLLSAALDAVAEGRDDARVLSLACGHLREAQASDAVRRRAIAELVAIDQDAESLAVVEREQRMFNVRVKRASVKRFVASGLSLGHFDLAYSAGLYDYLDDDDAAAVTEALFRSLRPGGRMIVANFASELRDIAYMEAVMDWRLIYRNEAALASLAAVLPEAAIAALTTTRDSLGNVVYMTVDRA